MRFRSLLPLAITVPLLATGITVIAVMYAGAKRRSSDLAEKLLASVTARAAQEVSRRSDDAVQLAHMLARLSDDSLALQDSDRLAKQFLGMLRASTAITWISFSDTQGDFTGVYRDDQGRTLTNQSRITNGKTALVEAVVQEDGTRSVLRTDPDSGYDPRKRDFFIQASQKQDVVWLPPYVFYGRNTPGITCAIAVRSPGNQLIGVFSVDYDLNALSSFARTVVASEHSQVMVFTADQVLIAHSSAKIIADTAAKNAGQLVSLSDTHDPVTATFQKNLSASSLQTKSGGAEFIRFDLDRTPWLACILPVQLQSGPAEWIATVAPVHDFAPTAWQSARGPIIVVGIGTLLAIAIAGLLAHAITRPILTLLGISDQVGKGDLDVKVHLGPLQEFQQLARGFESMLANLRDWVRVRTSLQIAMEIQRSLLPRRDPKLAGFDIAGYSAYCDETGGDYYDYILIDPVNPTHLVVALGDVMGHGLPSALLMAGARGILRSSISAHTAPGALLGRLNALLYQDTDGKRFMTMLLVSFDLRKRSFVWSSAGHDSPIIYSPQTNTFEMPEGGEVPLGIVDDVEYGNYHFERLAVGQVIFIGSDGVWESFNSGQEQFGKDRLKMVIAATAHLPAEDIKRAVLSSLQDFAGPVPAKDDITFVIIKICAVAQTARRSSDEGHSGFTSK